MDPVQLETLSRTQFGTPAAQKARTAGQYPATVVGGGKPTVQVTVDARAFDTALRHQARGFTLTGEGQGERVALHEIGHALGHDRRRRDRRHG